MLQSSVLFIVTSFCLLTYCESLTIKSVRYDQIAFTPCLDLYIGVAIKLIMHILNNIIPSVKQAVYDFITEWSSLSRKITFI